MNRELFVSYAQEFTAFLTRTLDHDLLTKINLIILFGSTVREEATKKSDVDIFVDVTDSDKEIDRALDDIIEEFYDHSGPQWKSLGIDHPISVKVGSLSEWDDLLPAIITDGLILYGKYKPEHVSGDHYVIFSWENNMLTESKRVFLNRKLYGYNRRGSRYDGLIEKYDGRKLSPGSIVVPLKHLRIFQNLFHKYRVPAKILQAQTY